MALFGFDEQSVQRIVRSVKTTEGKRLGNVGQPPGHRLDAPIPMFLAKLNGSISASCDGTATIWGATAASTALDASLGTTEAVRDWFGIGGSSGDKVMLFRQFGNERLYFTKPPNNYLFHCKFTAGDGGGGWLFTPDITGGTTWAGTSAYPVYDSAGTILIAQTGCYVWRATMELLYTWTQPTDSTHHWANITLTGDISGGSVGGSQVIPRIIWPAKETTTVSSHAHAMTAVGGSATVHCSMMGFVERTVDTPVAFSITGSGFTASTSGPAVTDLLVSGQLDIHRIPGA